MGVAGSSADGACEPDQLPALTEIERKVLDFIERAALQERQIEPKDEIAHQLGFSGTGTIRGIELRLERKGYIKIKCYQRGRQIYAVRLDKWTKPPMCIVPHWTTILDKSARETPTLSITKMMEFPTIVAEVNRLQRERNLTFQDAQIVLMSYGVSMLGFVRAKEQVA
jgi:SOS-response transcriptional repressor LexA